MLVSKAITTIRNVRSETGGQKHMKSGRVFKLETINKDQGKSLDQGEKIFENVF